MDRVHMGGPWTWVHVLYTSRGKSLKNDVIKLLDSRSKLYLPGKQKETLT